LSKLYLQYRLQEIYVNHTSFLRGLLVVSLFVAPAFGIAAHHNNEDHSMPDGQDQHQRMDPVERAQKHLDKLEQKLNLQADQQAAWKAYAGTALARASERAKHMEEHHAKPGDHHGDMDTASRLEHMSQRMRERADKMQQMAQDTRTFQQVLTPEQQMTFDKYWKSQFGRGKMRRRN
jgi:predicted DNA-binding protein YlxM (UPF0122 family)